jgi:glutamate racemase
MIGVFDSGSGGLSVLRAIQARKSTADVVYFGDIKHAPYGVRPHTELLRLTMSGLQTLRMFGSQEIVSACNSVSPIALQHGIDGARLIEMTRPARRMMQGYSGGRVLLLATPATVASGIYASAFNGFLTLEQHPVRDLAGAIEFGASDDKIREIVRGAFAERWGQSFDHVFLGCTHYPFAHHIIEEEARAAFGDVNIVDPAHAVAEDVERQFDTNGSGSIYFRTSQDSEHFRRRVAELFPAWEHTIKVISPYDAAAYSTA